MKQEITKSQFIDILTDDNNASWTYNQASALYDFLESYAEECGREYELDVVALRCEFSGYEDEESMLEDYGKESLEELEEETLVIKCEDGEYVVQCY